MRVEPCRRREKSEDVTHQKSSRVSSKAFKKEIKAFSAFGFWRAPLFLSLARTHGLWYFISRDAQVPHGWQCGLIYVRLLNTIAMSLSRLIQFASRKASGLSVAPALVQSSAQPAQCLLSICITSNEALMHSPDYTKQTPLWRMQTALCRMMEMRTRERTIRPKKWSLLFPAARTQKPNALSHSSKIHKRQQTAFFDPWHRIRLCAMTRFFIFILSHSSMAPKISAKKTRQLNFSTFLYVILFLRDAGHSNYCVIEPAY